MPYAIVSNGLTLYSIIDITTGSIVAKMKTKEMIERHLKMLESHLEPNEPIAC